MAVVTFYKGIEQFDTDSWSGYVGGNNSKITIKSLDGSRSETFTGSFRIDYWSEEITGGTLNGYTYVQDKQTFLTISGMKLDALQVYNLYIRAHGAPLLSMALGGNDTLNGSSQVDHLEGLSGDDKLYGNAGDDELYGGDGDDLLDGGAGIDYMVGGAGNDTYIIDRHEDEIVENANGGTDTVNVAISVSGSYTLGSNLENATLINKVAFDLTGNELDNVLKGNAANNRLEGGAGADRLEGGAGNDTYVIDEDDTIIDTAGIDTVEAGFSYTLGTGLENLVLTGSNAISGTGNTLANTLDGSQNQAANMLSGKAGNDIYIVGVGDTVIEDDAKGGIDLVKSYADFTLGLNLENLTLLGSDDISATGNEQANVLIGNSGANTLDGAAGVDTLQGGDGNDTYVVDLTSKNALEDKITEKANEGIDTIVLRGGNTSLTKATTLTLAANLENLDASQTGVTKLNLTGNALGNELTGNEGDNLLDGGAGADRMRGGLGNDTYVVDNLEDEVIEDVNEGNDTVNVAIAVSGAYTLGSNLENATLINKVAFDLIGNELDNILKGNAAANRLEGGAGADRLEGGAGNDTYVIDEDDTIVDTAGIDTVEAGFSYTLGAGLENLVLIGNAAISGTGNNLANVIDGSQNQSANVLSGLGGNDTYIVGAGDTVFEGDVKGGIDLVKSYVDFTLGANLENLTLLGTGNLSATGNELANIIIGNSANNVLDGKAGVDTLQGGDGNDIYIVDLTSKNALEDRITEKSNEGIDTIVLRGGSDSLTKATTLTLGANLENLDASATGLTKLNLTGNALNNVLTGNAAQNIFTGGAGDDIFRFTSISDTGLDKSTWDIITDFKKKGNDKIDLSGIDADTSTDEDDGFHTLIDANADFTAAGQLKFVGGILYGNVNGDTQADFAIQLTGVTSLSLSDFIV